MVHSPTPFLSDQDQHLSQYGYQTMGFDLDISLEDEAVVISHKFKKKSVKVAFMRTIRVADTNEGAASFLPPSAGRFQLFKVSDYRASLPAIMACKGGLFFPTYPQEAMWIDFESESSFIVNVYLGGMNAVSGEPYLEDMATRMRQGQRAKEGNAQDYLVTPQQPWLDGFAVTDGKVRQFVATSSSSGYSVEAQLTGADRVCGLQIEVTPRKVTVEEVGKYKRLEGLEKAKSFQNMVTEDNSERKLAKRKAIVERSEIYKSTLRKTGSREQAVMRFWSDKGGVRIFVKTLTGNTSVVRAQLSETILNVKYKIKESEHTPFTQQRLIFHGQQLEDDKTLSDYQISEDSTLHLIMRLAGGGSPQPKAERTGDMSFAPGDFIKQTIMEDTSGRSDWGPERTLTFNVQVLDTWMFERVAGHAAPPTPVTRQTYANLSMPYCHIDEEPSRVHGNFEGVQSTKQLAETRGDMQVVDELPQDPNPVITLVNPGGILRPFRHVSDIKRDNRGFKPF